MDRKHTDGNLKNQAHLHALQNVYKVWKKGKYRYNAHVKKYISQDEHEGERERTNTMHMHDCHKW